MVAAEVVAAEAAVAAEAVAAEAVAAEVAARFSEQSLMGTDALEVWLVLAVERSLHDAESMGHWGELLKV